MQYDLLLAVETAEDVVLRRPLDVVADEQVEQAVAVEIEPERRGAERRPAGEAARSGHVEERALAGVPEQPVLSDAGDEQVGIAVVVEVADGGAHSVELDIEAGAARHVGKCAVAVVAEQAQRRPPARVAGPVHAVDQQDVQPAIGVVIEKCAPGPERFGQQPATVGAVVVLEIYAGGAGDIGESEPRRRSLAVGRTWPGGGQAGADRPLQEGTAVHGRVTSPWWIA